MSKKLSKTAYGGVEGANYQPYLNEGDRVGGNGIVLIAGILLAILFAASTAYSGMKSGLTVAAGIPGAIIGSAIIAAFAKSKGVLGKNLLQGMASGGESIASGIIFVLPAVLLLGAKLSFFEAALTGIAGTIFGIGVISLVQEYLLVEEHGKLMYPESMAIAETIVASEGAGDALKYMSIGAAIGGLITLVTGSFLGVINNVVSYVNEVGYKWKFQVEVSPMLLGIGYIVGLDVSLLMLAGSILANFAVLPLIGYFSGMAAPTNMVWNNPELAVQAMDSGHIYGAYLRYMGAGIMLAGGLIGAIKLIPTIITSVRKTLGASNASAGAKAEGGMGKLVLLAGILLTIVMSFVISGGNIVMALVAGLVAMIFAFLFTIVSGRLTGTIGTSNLPVSGMTIASLVITTLVFLVFKWTSPEQNKSLLLFGTFMVTAIATAGGFTQSHKVGFVLGGRKEEMTKYYAIASLVGVLTVVGVIILLTNKLIVTGDNAEFALPQANLMATLTKGIISGELPWTMIIIGIVIGIFFHLAHLPVMTAAIGFYLPISTTSIIFLGALIRFLVEKFSKTEADKEARISNGISLSAGLVAGASIIGLIGIFFQVFEVIKPGELTGFMASNNAAWLLLAALIGVVSLVIVNAGAKKNVK